MPASFAQREGGYIGEEGSSIIEAVAAFNSGNYDAAEGMLAGIIRENPRNDAAYYYLGCCAMGRNQLTQAQQYFRKASELDPGNFWYKNWLAVSYSLSGNTEMTIASYEELLKEFPKKTDIYFSLVNLYLKNNQMDKAMDALDQIETIFGKNEAVTSTKYDILLSQNKPEEAFEELKKYNEEFSSSAILTKMGDFSMAEYKDSAALGYYNEALALENDYMPALLGKAEVYRTRRDYDNYFKTLDVFLTSEGTPVQSKAQYMNMLLQRSDSRFIQNFMPQLDSAIETLNASSSQDSTSLLLAARYYYSTGRQDKAKEYFRSNSTIYPESASARIYYIQYLWNRQDFSEMEKECEKARKDFPDEQDFVEIQNVVFYNNKNFEGILKNCQETISKYPDDTAKTIPAMSMMGDVYHELGNEKEAFKTYRNVLKLDPDYAPVLNNYAYFLALKGKRLKEACEMSKKTIDQEPDNATYLDTYGWILHLLGRDDEAKAVFKHAMIYGGKESATTLEHYSTVLEELGEKDLSEVYKDQAAKLKAEGKE